MTARELLEKLKALSDEDLDRPVYLSTGDGLEVPFGLRVDEYDVFNPHYSPSTKVVVLFA
jgi:hypothetical protein